MKVPDTGMVTDHLLDRCGVHPILLEQYWDVNTRVVLGIIMRDVWCT